MVGPGAVGARVARQLLGAGASVTLVHPSAERLSFLRQDLGRPVGSVQGGPTDIPADADVVVLATPGDHRRAAEIALERGRPVVSTSDDLHPARSLLDLDEEARARRLHVVVGAAMAPGLSCVLARSAASRLDEVTEIHVFSMGTGGPACARHHHACLTDASLDWVDGAWVRRPGGSGRELVWFPEPVGGADCYRAELVDPLLLVPAFPGVARVTARMEATRRDRLTSWLPMLRPPHPEGLVGAVRVEVRGFVGGVADTVVFGASSPPAVAAGAVAATAALWAAAGLLGEPGAGGLATLVPAPGDFLADLAARGVMASVFEGADALVWA